MVIGGAALYEAFAHRAGQIYLTRVHVQVTGDTFFTELDSQRWEEVEREDFVPDERNPYPYSFLRLVRCPE